MSEDDMKNLKCPRCSGGVNMGVAIRPTREAFARATPFDLLINKSTIKIIDVYKCVVCGYSCDDEYDLLWVDGNEKSK